jgi:EmrB/QacA subfamily drug resistance transporter
MRGTAHPAVKWWTLAVVAIGTFMLMLDVSVVNVALPDIRADLGADFTGIQWVLDAYALTLAAFLLTAGSLADAVGRRLIFQIGFAIFVIASFTCGMAHDVLTLDIARGLQGVGGAVLYAVGPAMIGHEFHGRQRGLAFGVFGGVSGLAFAAGPLIGGALTSGVNWRWIFFLNVPFGLAAMVITALRVRESRNRRARGVDVFGLVTFSGALTALVLGLIRGPDDGWASAFVLSLFATAMALLVVFFVSQRSRGERAMLDLSLFRNVTFVGLSAVALLANVAGPASIFLEANFVQNVLHLTPWQTGLRFLPLTVTILVFGAVAGMLTTTLPMRFLFFGSLVALAVGLSLIQNVDQHSSWTALLPSMIVMGVGMGLFNPPRAAAAIGVTEPARAGMASGINETFQQVGVAIGIAAIGSVFENSVANRFSGTAVGHTLAAAGADTHTLGKAVASGAIQRVVNGTPHAIQGAVRVAGETSFVGGLHLAIWVLAGVSVVGSVVGLLFVRTRDLHASALTGIPPEDETDDKTAVADVTPATVG